MLKSYKPNQYFQHNTVNIPIECQNGIKFTQKTNYKVEFMLIIFDSEIQKSIKIKFSWMEFSTPFYRL